MTKKSQKSGITCFKRWSRKNYGIFASLGREVNIGVLSVSMSIVSFSTQTVLAQADTVNDAQRIKLEAIKVVAQKVNPTHGVVTPITVYSRNSLSTSPLQTIESALKVNPAVDLRERGAKGVQADISLFGGSSDQTMILLNGVNFTDARTGHQSHSLPIDIESVSSINLIGGISGVGAFTGALNIVTAPLKPNYMRAEISGGQHGYIYTNISGAATKNNLSAMYVGSLRRSNGYTQNTDFRTINLFTRLNYDSEKFGFLDVQAGYQNKYFGANAFYSTDYPDQAEQTETFLASARWIKQLSSSVAINSIISYRKNYDRFELFRNNSGAPAWYEGHNYHTTDNVGAELFLDYLWKMGKTSFGADYTMNHIYSTLLGETLSKPKKVEGENGIFYTKGKTRNIVNGWIRHTVKIGKFDISGNLNFAHSPYGNNAMWSLASEYTLSNNFMLFANATKSMRLPTFTDLYYTTKTHIANSNLKSERAVTYKLGADFHKNKFSAQISTYYRRGKDIIDWVKKSFDSKWETMQITTLYTYGADVYMSYNFGGFVREISAGCGHVKINKKSENFISKYALDYLRDKVSLRAKLQIDKNISLDAIGTWCKRNGSFEIIKDKIEKYKPYWAVDARLNWEIKHIKLYIDATNILNKTNYDFGGLKLPDRWISGGIVLTI